MDIEINEVQEIIKNLEDSGELSIKEEKYLKVAKLCVQLAAENVGLKSFGDTLFDMYKGLEISGGGIHDEQSVVCQQAALDAAMSAFEEIETPATDRIVAWIKADKVEEFAEYISLYNSNAEEHATNFAKQLREGANKC